MNKYQKTVATFLSLYVLLVLIILPRLVLSFIAGENNSWWFRLSFIGISLVSAFIVFVWFTFDTKLDPKKSKSIKNPKTLKKIQFVSHIGAFVIAVIVLTKLIPLAQDILLIASEENPVLIEATIQSEEHPGLGVLFSLQHMTLENGEHYTSWYTTQYVNEGESYKLLVLPNSNHVLDVKKL